MFKLLDAVDDLADSGATTVSVELSLNEFHLFLQVTHLFPTQRTRPRRIPEHTQSQKLRLHGHFKPVRKPL